MKYALTNGRVYTGKHMLDHTAVVIAGGRVFDVVAADRLDSSIDTIDLVGHSVAPGFIDLQVNGGGGYLINDDPSVETIERVYEAHRRFGTLNFLPTMISTNSLDSVLAGAEAVAACMGRRDAGVLGLHLEGPYIDESMAGVHDKRAIRRASQQEIARLLALPDAGVIRLLTASPLALPREAANSLVREGILLSIGHSNATYEEACQAFDHGFSGVTHLFNAMSQLGGREPGVVGAALARTHVWAGIIADGLHVHLGAVLAAKQSKRDRLMLVTDAMPPVGTPDASFMLGSHRIECVGGKCTTAEGALAGSALDMATAVRNCVTVCGIPKDEALRMASTYPARYLGVDHELGMIAPGYLADLVILDDQLHVQGIVTRGLLERFAS